MFYLAGVHFSLRKHMKLLKRHICDIILKIFKVDILKLNPKIKKEVNFVKKVKHIISLMISCVLILLAISGCGLQRNVKKEHSFSIGEDKQVYFAPSNLQYCPKTGIWRFADNAYDTVGADNEYASGDYEGWLDLFCWGANGISGVEPYSTVSDNMMYGDGHNSIAGTKWDFSRAVNDQLGSDWRMFTHDEIHYILMFRENAEKLFGYGTIDEIRGLFILPDDWKCPDGITFTPSVDAGFENQYDWYYTIGDKENYTYNIFTKEDWALIEQAGGVFLPVTGMRSENCCDHIGISGHYWTSSNYGEEFANCLCLFEHDLFLEGNFDRGYALGVRLIRDAN